MVTKLRRSRETMIHPITFFDQRSYFSQSRQLIDGHWLLRQYFGRLLEDECGYANDEIKAELKGLTDLKPLYWDEAAQNFLPHVGADVGPVQEKVLIHAAGASQARSLTMDPVVPLRRLLDKADQAPTLDYPQFRNGKNNAFRYGGKFTCTIKCPGIKPGSWNMLALVGPAELPRLEDALGPLPKAQGMDDAEWLLRHAFANREVAQNSVLASTLSRVPLLFGKSEAPGEVRFQVEGIPKGGDYGIPRNHWLVGILDTEAYLQKRH